MRIKNEKGSLNLELALILGLIALAVIASLFTVGNKISDLYLQGASGENVAASVGGLEVLVTDDGNIPVADANVTVASSENAFSATEVTETNGLAVFENVPVGEVDVTIEGDNIQTKNFTVTVEEDTVTATSEIVIFNLVESPVTDFTWTTSDGEATVVSYIGNSLNVIVPSTYMGLSVTTIGDAAFYGCSDLTSVVIPNSVTTIGSYAFTSCFSLTSVTIPNSVTTIGDAAFENCSSLTSITIPNNVTTIGYNAFRYCTSLTSVVIPNSVTTIGSSAFNNCSSLTSVTIPNSVTTIGGSVFMGCSSLTSVVIPNSVTSIGDAAFAYCSNLTSVTIPNSVTTIGNSAFSGCSNLTSITIPNSVTTISDYAFESCSNLTSITIPNSVTTIGSSAFEGCSKLAVAYILGTPQITTSGYSSFPASTSGSATSIANPSGTYYGTTYSRWYTNAARTTERTAWPMTRTSTAGTTLLYGSP